MLVAVESKTWLENVPSRFAEKNPDWLEGGLRPFFR